MKSKRVMDKKLFVVLISPGWPLEFIPNGIVTYVKNIILGFSGKVDAIVMTNNLAANKSEVSIIDLSRYDKKRSFFIKVCDRILRSQLTPEILYKQCLQYKSNYACRSIITAINSLDQSVNILELEESFGRAKFIVDKLEIPIITRLHGPWFIHGPIMKLDNERDYQYRVESEGEAIAVSRGVTAPSLDVLNRVRDFYGLPLKNAKVIPNPVPSVPAENQWEYQAGKKQTILVVGRFDLHKGGDLAIEAFQLVAMQNKEVELLFIGPDRGVKVGGKDYTFSSYVDSFVPDTAIKERIKFLGHCNVGKIASLRQSSTVTLMPSRYDNFPMSLLEAVAAGSPVVAMKAGGMKEIVIHGFNGLLAKPENSESMAENILELLNDPEKMQLMSKNAIKDSQERFSPNTVAKQTEAYYRSILNS